MVQARIVYLLSLKVNKTTATKNPKLFYEMYCLTGIGIQNIQKKNLII